MEDSSAPLLGKSACIDSDAEEHSLLARLVIEFIGTFFLVLTVYLTVAQAQQEAGLAIGTCLAIMIFMGGHISGGHYNPAVTLAIVISGSPRSGFASEKFKDIVITAGAYMGAQLCAGLIAAAIGFGLTGVQWGPAPGDKFRPEQAFGAEVLFTFALALIVLNVATSTVDGSAPNHYYGLAIGWLVFVGATAVGDISGAVFNPAVGTGITMMDVFMGGSMANIWIYWVGPMTGAAMAAGVFRLQNPQEYKK